MNLLILIHSLHSGGAERVTSNLVNYWAGKGWRITVVTLASREQDFYTLHPTVRRIALDMTGESSNFVTAIRSNLQRVIALRRILLEDQPDVALGMMSGAGVLLILATLFMPRIATIASERIYPPMMPLSSMWQRLRQWTYPKAAKVTMLTSEGLAWLNTAIPKANGIVMPNPIPYPLPVTEPRLNPTSIVGLERKLLLAVGRLDPQKGFDLLLTAFAELATGNPSWDLVILGEGPQRQALESQIEALGLQGRVYLPGRAGNVGGWYQRADLYVMTSRFEGFPNTLGEAMAHGCAAVSFDCDTGPRDIIRHQVDGMLVPNGDIYKLKLALADLMADDALRQQMANQAIEVRKRYSIEKIAGMWEKLFAEVSR